MFPKCALYLWFPHRNPVFTPPFSHRLRKTYTANESKKFYFMDVLFKTRVARSPRPVFLNRRAANWYPVLASIIPGRERPEETTICYNISLVQLITILNIILYLSTCHNIYISVLILFMIMP